MYFLLKNPPCLFEEILSGFISLLQALPPPSSTREMEDFRQSSNPGERPPLKHLRTSVTPGCLRNAGLLLDLFVAPAKEKKNNPPLILQAVVLQN